MKSNTVFQKISPFKICLGRGKNGSMCVCVLLRRYRLEVDCASKCMHNKCSNEIIQLRGVPVLVDFRTVS